MSPQQVNLGDPPARTQDPGFVPSPLATDPKRREKASEPDPGFIPSPTENSSSESTHGAGGEWQDAGLFERAWTRANTVPKPIDKNLLARARQETAKVQGEAEKQVASGKSPLKAGVLTFEAGVDADIDKIASGFFTPISMGLSALSFAEGLPFVGRAAQASKAVKATVGAAKVTQLAAGTAFGTQATDMLLTPKQPGESTADYLEREGMAGSQSLFSAAGNYASVKDMAHTFLRSKLKMSDDLAGKVSENVAKMTAARAKEASTVAAAKENLETKQRAIDNQRAQDVNSAQANLEHSINQLEGQTASRTSNIERTVSEQTTALQDELGKLDAQKVAMGRSVIVDTAHTVAQFEAQFDVRFSEIGEKIPGSVSNAGDIRSLINEEAQNHGVQPNEIPRSALAALGSRGLADEERLPESRGVFVEGKGGGGFIGEPPQSSEGLNFDELTRVKNDLYNAAYSNKDGAVRSVLFRSAERVSDMQEKAARAAGQGEQYGKLKHDYMQFVRGIGSSDVRDWLSAQNMSEQELSGKISQLVRPSNAAALRSILRSVGIDTKGFDDTMEGIRTGKKSLANLPKERLAMLRGVKEGVPEAAAREEETASEEIDRATAASMQATKAARGEAATSIREARTEREGAVKAAEAEGEIIPGRTTSELAGKSQNELLKENLGVMAAKMKGIGYLHPWRLMVIGIGLFDIMSGLAGGKIAEAARGAAYAGAYLSPTILPKVLSSAKFQDWVIREVGVEPHNVAAKNRLRKAIADLYPALRAAAKSQAPASTLSLGQPPSRVGSPGTELEFAL